MRGQLKKLRSNNRNLNRKLKKMASFKTNAPPRRDTSAAAAPVHANSSVASPRDPTPPANRVKFTKTSPEVVTYPPDARAPSPLPSFSWDQRPGNPPSPGKAIAVPSISPERSKGTKKGKGKGKGKGKKKGKGKGKDKGKVKGKGKDARKIHLQPSKDVGAHLKQK